MPFVLVKNELLEGELNGVAARSWRAQAPWELDFELARLPKRSLYGPHLTIGYGHLKASSALLVT